MPSNHISNQPYHEWLAETHKHKKKESNMTKEYDLEEDISRAIDIANEINIHQLECIIANWEDRITVFSPFNSSPQQLRIENTCINGSQLQLNVIQAD